MLNGANRTLGAAIVLMAIASACTSSKNEDGGRDATLGADAGRAIDATAGGRDALMIDAAAMDAESSDASSTDVESIDAQGMDAALSDAAGIDATAMDAGDPCSMNNGGCAPIATCTSSAGAAMCQCPIGYAGDGRTCQNVAAALAGLRWTLPCTSGDVGNNVCNVAGQTTTSTALSGAPNTDYDVTIRFRGVVEQKTYAAGTSSGAYFRIGGSPNADGFNVYSLTVSAPAQTYYLNAGQTGIYNCFPIDYVVTITVSAGAMVTLFGDPIDGREIRNTDAMHVPIVIPNIPPAPMSFDGQFIQMDVVGVVVH